MALQPVIPTDLTARHLRIAGMGAVRPTQEIEPCDGSDTVARKLGRLANL